MFPLDWKFGEVCSPCLAQGAFEDNSHLDKLEQDNFQTKAADLNLLEVRTNIDSQRNYFPSSGPKNSSGGPGRGTILVVIGVVLILACLLAIWRWVA